MDLSIMASGEVFLSYLHSLRKKLNLRKNSTRALHALVILSMLIPSAIVMAAPSHGDDSAQIVELSQFSIPEQEALQNQPPRFEHSQSRVGKAFNSPDLSSEDLSSPIRFELFPEAGAVGWGEEITFTAKITNQGIGGLEFLTFADELEEGFVFVSADTQGLVYEPKTKTLSATIDQLGFGDPIELKYTLRVTGARGSPEGEIWVHTAVLEDSLGDLNVVASTELWVGAPAQSRGAAVKSMKPGGGWTSAGPISVFTTPGTFMEETLLAAKPVEHPSNGPENQFQIELVQAQALSRTSRGKLKEQQAVGLGTIVERLPSPVPMVISFDEIADLSHPPAGKNPFVSTYDESLQTWIKVPITEIDLATNSVRVQTDHFSTWGVGLGDALPQNGANVLLFDEPYTSLFTGRSRFSYPIWTPPGRGGLQPSINLSYTSGTADGLLGDVQAPWVGMGWSVDDIEIVRQISTDENGYGYTNDFALTLNGVMYELIQDPNDNFRYHTKDASFLYIELHSPALGNPGDPSDVTNTSKEWWEIAATDGTRYYLGRTTDAEQLALMDGYACTSGNPCIEPNGAYAASGYAGVGVDVVALRWRVERIEDTHGNYMLYTYDEETKNVGFATFDRASYLESIAFTGWDDPQEQNDLDPGYCVAFNSSARSGDNPAEDLEIWDNSDSRQLDEIELRYGSCTTGTVVRTYSLDYGIQTVPSVDGTLVLESIGVTGGGFTDSGTSIVIPSTDAPTVTFDYGVYANQKETCVDCEKWRYPRLETVNNGYEAELDYTYEKDSRGDDYWYNWRVAEVDVHDGLSAASSTEYSYSEPVYTGVGEDEDAGALIGYTYVTEITNDFDGTSALSKTKHKFGTEDPEIGRTYWTEWKKPDDTVLRKVENTWATDNSGVPEGVTFLYLSQVSKYIRSDSTLNLISKERFTHDPATGNLIEQRVYEGSRLYRKTEIEYEVDDNPDVWILSLPIRQVLNDRYDNLLSDVRMEYSDAGDLTFTQARTGSGTQTVDTKFFYDSYGNMTETCAYSDYGTAGTPRSGDCPTLAQSTSVTFETTLHTFPITVTNDLNQSTSTGYLISLGLPYETTDPNGYETSLTYNGLGQVLTSTAPGFSVATTKYTYPTPDANGQVDAPYSVKLETQDTLGPSAPVYRSVWGIYDGLGRTLQAQVYDADAGQLVITDAAFNAMGLVEKEGLPRTKSGTGGTYYAPNWGSIDYTEYDFDALRRVIEVTRPGNRTTETLFDGLVTEVVDPNGHKIRREVDALGRMIEVRVYTGDDPSWSLYATTRYTYDQTDRLTVVIDARGNQTEIEYDWLRRKTSMDDPDMGDWSYTYNALGNLTRQNDARGQRICLYYDDINRLLGKHYRTDDSCPSSPTYDVSYTYDGVASGNKGIGLRTAMGDDSGTTTWFYSNYGRTVEETRDLTGITNDYTFTTTADWLGRVDAIEYPNGDDVAYEYDSLGRVAEMDLDEGSGASTLVELAYNTLSQITSSVLGNGVRVQNCYQDNTHRLAARRAYTGSSQSCSETEPSSPLINFTYSYDEVGNILSFEDYKLGESFTFAYDELNRLTVAEGIGQDEFAYRQAFSYDSIGNITQVESWEGEPAGSGTYEEDESRFWYVGSWNEIEDAGASGGTFKESNVVGAAFRLEFTGAGLNYVRPVGPDQGIAHVYFDHDLAIEVDNYAADSLTQESITLTMPEGDHLLEIVVSGEKNESSSGTEIGLDAIEVLASAPTPTATLTPSITPTATDTATITNTPTVTDTPTVTPTSPYIPEKLFDFGTSSSPIETGFTRVTKATAYSTSLGYGWTLTSSLNSRDRGTGTTNLKRDFVFSSSSRTFRVDLPNGTYPVSVTMGDKSYSHNQMAITANGELVATVTTSKNQWHTETFYVQVSDGILNLRFSDSGGSDPNWVLNGIEIGGSGTPTPTSSPTSFSGGTGSYEETSSLFNYTGSWDEHESTDYSGGAARIADQLGDDVEFNYLGARFTYLRSTGPDRGYAEICAYDDSEMLIECEDVDNYSQALSYQQPFEFNYPYGQYRVTISYTGRKNPLATGYLIDLDKVDVSGATPTPTPSVTNTPQFTPSSTPTPTATPAEIGVSIGSNVVTHKENHYAIDFDYEVYAGNGRVLVVTYAWRRDSHQNNVGAKYNDVQMTLVATKGDPGGDYVVAMYYLVNPPVGTHSVEINLVSGAKVMAGVYTLYGVDYSDPIVDYATSGWTGSSVSITLASNPGDLGLDVVVIDNFSNLIQGEDQTEIWELSDSGTDWSMKGASSWEEVTDYHVNMSYSISGSEDYGYIAAVFRAWRPDWTPTPTPDVWPTPITQTPVTAGAYENTAAAWNYFGDWEEITDAGDSGGSRHWTELNWTVAQITFNGNGFDFYHRKAPDLGVAELWVDDVKVLSVDQFNETAQAQQNEHVTLPDGDHVLEVRRAERKNGSSSGFTINIDKVIVYDSATPTPTPTRTATTTPTATLSPTPTLTYRYVTLDSTVTTVARNHTLHFDHTVADREDRLLVLTYTYRRNSSQSDCGATYDGTSMTKVASKGDKGGDYVALMYYLTEPPVGTHQVSICLSSAANFAAGVYTLYGVDQFDPLVDFGSAGYEGTSVSKVLDSQQGDLGIDILVLDNSTSKTPGADQVQKWANTSGSSWTMVSASSVEHVTGSSTTLSWSWNGSQDYAYVAAIFRAARADPATTTPGPSPTSTPTASPFTDWEYAYYTYDSSHPHAVATIERGAGPDNFIYDSIGGMTARDDGSDSWIQGFDEEGRLETLDDGADDWTFTYDGDGVRVIQENPDGTKTVFLGGGAYEIHIDGATETVTRYYSVGGQRVMVDSTDTYYLLTDHLGSVVAVTDSSGNPESAQRYLPYGGGRFTTGITETDFGFTGQRGLSTAGLMDYNARFYNPMVGRFVSADKIVPELGNPMALNRYSYVYNNPIMFIDPTGHMVDWGGGGSGCVDKDGDGICDTRDIDQELVITEAEGIYEEHIFSNVDYWSFSLFTNIPTTVITAGAALLGLAEPLPLEEAATIPAVLFSSWISLGATISWDQSGNVYLNPGVSVGRNIPYPVSVTLHMGNLDPAGVFGPGQASAEEVQEFLGGGPSVSHGLSWAIVPSVARVWVPGLEMAAWEFGFGTPQVNLVTYTFTSIRLR